MKFTGYNSVKRWGIVSACSVVHCLLFIPFRASGLFFVAFLDRYDTNRQNASFFIIVAGALRCLAGPLTGYLGEIIEIRILIAVGCLVAALGVGISFFAEDIITVIVCMGFIYGVGINLGSTLIPQTLKQHFKSNIAMANGIFSAGSSFATFIIIPVLSTLLDNYGVSGALLLTCGVMLHAVPVAMLLRDPKYKKTSLPCTEKELTAESNSKEYPKVHENCSVDSTNIANILSNSPIVNNNETDNHVAKSHIKSSKYMKEEHPLNSTANYAIKCNQDQVDCNSQINFNATFQPPITGKKNNLQTYPSIASKQDCISREPELAKNKNKYYQALKTFAILKDPSFLVIMFCLSAHTYIAVFISTIIIDISRDKGIVQNLEQYFIMFYTVTHIVGFTSLGWITDKGHIKVANYIAICSVCMGLSCCAIAFSSNFPTMMFATVGFGLSTSAVISAGPSLVYDFMEEKMHTMAIASRLLFYVPLTFTMAPLIGYFRGSLGSYDGVLYYITAVSMVCAALLVLLPHLKRRTKYESNSSMNP